MRLVENRSMYATGHRLQSNVRYSVHVSSAAIATGSSSSSSSSSLRKDTRNVRHSCRTPAPAKIPLQTSVSYPLSRDGFKCGGPGQDHYRRPLRFPFVNKVGVIRNLPSVV